MMHDLAGYTPFAGRKLRGWPVTVLSRGRIIVTTANVRSKQALADFLARTGGEAAKPTGRLMADMDPAEFRCEVAVSSPARWVRVEK